MATDSHVVSPLFFPGGDIGCLSVHGTINDVAMAGARPLYLAAGFILEEGFPLADLKRIVESMAARRARGRRAGRHRRHQGRRAGQGRRRVHHHHRRRRGAARASTSRGDRARPATRSSSAARIGDHGVAIMSLRENLTFETTIESDTAALHGLVAAMVAAVPGIHCLRDPTRGGLATTLNEIAAAVGLRHADPRGRAFRCGRRCAAACEFLGLDPLYVANEGKLVAICAAGRRRRGCSRRCARIRWAATRRSSAR